MEKIPVKIKIISKQADIINCDLFADFTQDIECKNSGDFVSRIVNTTGFLYSDNDKLSVTYIEDMGDFKCDCSVSFKKTCPEKIIISRGEPLNSSFEISENTKTFSLYKTFFGEIEMCVFAKKVKNNLSEGGGNICANYFVQLKNMNIQNTKIRIEIRVNDET